MVVGETLPGFPYAGPLNGASRESTEGFAMRAGFAARTPSGKVGMAEVVSGRHAWRHDWDAGCGASESRRACNVINAWSQRKPC